MMRPVVSLALLLVTLCLPLQAAFTAPPAGAAPRVRFTVAFAVVTDLDLKIARVNARAVPIDSLIVSRRPWGEARFEHLDLQVISGSDTARLLAALTKSQSFSNVLSETVRSGSLDTISWFPQTRTSAVKPGESGPQNASLNVPTLPIFQTIQFFLRPQVNSDGSIALSFALGDPTALPSPAGASASTAALSEDPRDFSLTSLGTVRSGETFALTGLLPGLLPDGDKVVAFVTPTVL